MATNLQYRLITARGIAWPLVICAAAAATLPFFAGLPLPSLSRSGAKTNPTPGVERFSQEVYVPNVARGCRWQYTNEADVQIADCGDDSETVRVVFERGKVTEYRVIARQDPNKPPASGVAGITSNQSSPPSPSQSVLPNQPASASSSASSRAAATGQAPLRISPGPNG